MQQRCPRRQSSPCEQRQKLMAMQLERSEYEIFKLRRQLEKTTEDVRKEFTRASAQRISAQRGRGRSPWLRSSSTRRTSSKSLSRRRSCVRCCWSRWRRCKRISRGTEWTLMPSMSEIVIVRCPLLLPDEASASRFSRCWPLKVTAPVSGSCALIPLCCRRRSRGVLLSSHFMPGFKAPTKPGSKSTLP